MSLSLLYFYPLSERQPVSTLRLTFATPTQLEPWEADLIAFFRECKAEVEEERKKAQEFADRLDLVCHSVKRLHWIL